MCTKVLPAPFLLKTTCNCYILSNFLKQQCWEGSDNIFKALRESWNGTVVCANQTMAYLSQRRTQKGMGLW